MYRTDRSKQMPKILRVRAAHDEKEERWVRKLAGSRHGPADWILHARMVVHSWDGQPVEAIAKDLGCSPQTVRRRLHRFDAEGIEGLGDHPKPGRPRRLTSEDDSKIIALVSQPPPGRLVTQRDGTMVARDEQGSAQWSLNALAQAAKEAGIPVKRSQIRRILLRERVRWQDKASPIPKRSSKPPASPPLNSTDAPSPGCGEGRPRTIAIIAGPFVIAFKEQSTRPGNPEGCAPSSDSSHLGGLSSDSLPEGSERRLSDSPLWTLEVRPEPGRWEQEDRRLFLSGEGRDRLPRFCPVLAKLHRFVRGPYYRCQLPTPSAKDLRGGAPSPLLSPRQNNRRPRLKQHAGAEVQSSKV
jgi:transposase